MRAVSRRSVLAGAAVLAAAGCGPPGAAPGAGAGAWEYTDDLGVRVRLPRRPERVVAYVGAAAALWDFGVRPVGTYGPLRDPDGRASLQAGNVDPGAVTSVGDGFTDFSLERLAALAPDLLIGSLNGTTAADRWVIKDTVARRIEAICPVYSIRESPAPLPAVVDAYDGLADAVRRARAGVA